MNAMVAAPFRENEQTFLGGREFIRAAECRDAHQYGKRAHGSDVRWEFFPYERHQCRDQEAEHEYNFPFHDKRVRDGRCSEILRGQEKP